MGSLRSIQLSGTEYPFQSIETIRGTQTAKTGSWTGVTADAELYDGKIISYYLPYAGDGNATLNLTLAGGGTTGAVKCYYTSTTRLTTHFGAYSTFCLIYHENWNINGTDYTGWWLLDRGYDANNVNILRITYSCITTSTLWGRYVLAIPKNETTIVPFNAVDNNTGTSKTLTTDSFDIFQNVVFRQVGSSIAANTVVPTDTMYQQTGNVVDLRYSFNTGKTLTGNKAVYIVCAPQTDGLVKLHTTPISQTLPTEADGLYYKYIGQAYDTYRIQLVIHQPAYEYKNGKICIVTNQYSPTLGSSTTTYLRNDGSWATPTDTKNTTGSTDTSSKIYLVGATSQAANPQTYSDNQVYATNGQLDADKIRIAETASLVYNSTTQALDFVFS